jgi:hypothetical protein
MLAQFRGCEPWNECYEECVDAAASALDEGDDTREVEEARRWASVRPWTPDPRDTPSPETGV